MEAIQIDGTLRTDLTRQSNLAIRKNGNIPAVVYGGTEVKHISVSAKAVKGLIYTPEFRQAAISINGTVSNCIVQDVQFDAVSNHVNHIDFLELVGDKKVVVDLPIKFVGVAKGVRAGGKLIPRLRKLKVRAVPSGLKPQLEVNVENLELGKNIRVKDVSFEGIEIITAPNNPIVSAFITRQLKQQEAADKAAAPKGAATKAAAPKK